MKELEVKKFNIYDLESRIIPPVARMQRQGIAVDSEYIHESIEQETRFKAEEEERFYILTGERFKDSSKVFAEIFRRKGIPFGRTFRGNPSFSEEELLKNEDEISKCILKIRFYHKRINTYYVNLLKYKQSDGKIHAIPNPFGTRTGRFSYSQPNLQNISKKDEGERKIRNCFIPTKRYFFELDYSQVEYRIFADYVGHMELIERINSGEDLHQVTADLVGCDRQTAKTLNFCILYGGGGAKIASILKLPEYEGHHLRRLYFAKLPQIKRFIHQVSLIGKNRGYVRTWSGRKLRVQDPSKSYKLTNYLIQGGAAEVIKTAMINLYDKGLPSPILQVHDSLLFELDDASDIDAIKYIMENSYKSFNGVKLSVDVERGLRWGEMKSLSKENA